MKWILIAALAVMTGCAATKEMQVRSALTDAGLPPPMAACMATPMAEDLSTEQLRALGRAARTARGMGRMTEGQILDFLKRDLDPRTVSVVVRAGLGCFLRG